MMFPSGRQKLTYDDLLLLPDDGLRHELIDGEHYVTPSPTVNHQEISGNLYFLIRAWLEEHPVGRAFYAPLDIVFTQVDVVVPDLLYISNGRTGQILNDKHATGAPEIAVEIASPGTRRRDETIKRVLYERTGVSEYWTLDPIRHRVRVYALERGCFAAPRVLSLEAGDVLTTPHLPGLEIPLRRIFADAPGPTA